MPLGEIMRWKRFPAVAAACIFVVRGLIVQVRAFFSVFQVSKLFSLFFFFSFFKKMHKSPSFFGVVNQLA